MWLKRTVWAAIILAVVTRIIPSILTAIYETDLTMTYNRYTEELTKAGGVNWKVLYDLPVTGEMLINIPYMVNELNKVPTIQGTSYAKLTPIEQQHIVANVLDSYRIIDVNKDTKTLIAYKHYRAIVLLDDILNRGYLKGGIPPNYNVPNVTLRNNLIHDVPNESFYFKVRRIYRLTIPTIGVRFRVRVIGFGPSSDYTPYVLEDTYVKYTNIRRLILGTKDEPILEIKLNRYDNDIIKITPL